MTHYHCFLAKVSYFLLLLLLLQKSGVSAQTNYRKHHFEQLSKLTLEFRVNKVVVDTNYKSNALVIEALKRVLTQDVLPYIKRIQAYGYASPEGLDGINLQLSGERANAIRQILLNNIPTLEPQKIETQAMGENWEALADLVSSSDMPKRQEVLDIIRNVPCRVINNTSRKKQLMQMSGGTVWNYMKENFFPSLRTSFLVVLDVETPPEMKERITKALHCISQNDSTVAPEDLLSAVTVSLATEPITEPITDPVTELAINPVTDSTTVVSKQVSLINEAGPVVPQTDMPESVSVRVVRPLALKTNLLFDLGTLCNAEIEIPLSHRWSLAGECVFPWWLWESKQYALQLLSATLEARYWLTNNHSRQDTRLATHNPLAGWFLGIYGGGGYYDLEWEGTGYQGEFFIATGISAGYVKPLKRNLSLEFSFGLGYLKTDYRRYEAQRNTEGEWNLFRRENGTYTWIGPTKIKISLIWYPHFLKTKKGGRK